MTDDKPKMNLRIFCLTSQQPGVAILSACSVKSCYETSCMSDIACSCATLFRYRYIINMYMSARCAMNEMTKLTNSNNISEVGWCAIVNPQHLAGSDVNTNNKVISSINILFINQLTVILLWFIFTNISKTLLHVNPIPFYNISW
jgi:hypothetical protein